MKKTFLWVIFTCTLLTLAGCVKRERAYPSNVAGYKPIYSTSSSNTFSYTTAKNISHAGKIYVKDNYLFQVDVGTGIHIIDATNPLQASRSGFIKIDGCQELSINGHYLYTNNMADLVVIDISDYTHPVLAKRIAGAFDLLTNDSNLPPVSGYFECVDNSKGKVVGWYPDVLEKATCFY